MNIFTVHSKSLFNIKQRIKNKNNTLSPIEISLLEDAVDLDFLYSLSNDQKLQQLKIKQNLAAETYKKIK